MSRPAGRGPWCGVLLITALVSALFPFASALALEAESPAPAQPSSAAAKPETASGDEASRQREAEEVKRLTELYLRNQSVFLRKGELMVELNTFYNRNERQDWVPVTGGVALIPTTRRFIDTTLVARYGLLTDGLEVDLIAPVYVHAEQVLDVASTQLTTTDDGVGDFGAAVRYQVWYERGLRPSLIVDVQGKSRTGGTGLTGTGTWNAGGGVTLVKSIDPVVFFGRLGYTYNFASQTRDLGNIVSYQLGMGFSLNDRVSFNVQLSGANIGSSKFVTSNGTGGSTPLTFSTRHLEIMNLIFTSTVLVTKQLFIEPLVGVGLTEQSFTIIGLRVPYRF